MIWVLVAIIVVLLVIVGVLVARHQRSRGLRDDFGPEYKRVVAEHGDQRSAERELANRRERVERFEIRPLAPASREQYQDRWGAAQRQFVDEPVAAVGEAHKLVQQVMRERGYPVDEDFEQRAADISVEHPNVVENYRAANEISMRARQGQASTEELRQSIVHFRALFEDLLAEGDEAAENDAVSRDPERAGAASDQDAVTPQTTPRG